MIRSLIRQALRVRGDEPAVLCRIGRDNRTLDELRRFRLRPTDRVVDLDEHPMGESLGPHTTAGRDRADAARARGGGHSPADTEDVGLVAVVAASYTDLRRAVTAAVHLPRAAHVVVAVTDTPAPHRPPVPHAPGLTDWHGLHELQVVRVGRTGWACSLFSPAGLDVATVLASAFDGTGGRRWAVPPRPVVALHGPGAASWRPGDTWVTGVAATGPVPLTPVTPRADLALRLGTRESSEEWSDPIVPAVDRPVSGTGVAARGRNGARPLTVRGPDPVALVPPVDELTVNPIGFTPDASGPLGELTRVDGRTVVTEGRTGPVAVPPDGTVTDVDLSRLRYLRGVRVDWAELVERDAAVRAVASLAAGGVPLLSGPVPAWAVGLGEPLLGLLTDAGEADLSDRSRREEHSVRLRRVALRTHGVRARWRGLAAAEGIPVRPDPRVSVVLCTRRPEMVGFALAQIARQRGVDAEVVLALHGFPADLPEVAPAVADFRAVGLPLTVYEAEDARVFGAVFDDAVRRASGDLVAKWDDDDWYGPEHLADLLLAREYARADVVAVGPEFVYLQEVDTTLRRARTTETVTRSVAGSALLADRAVLDDAGGFRPLPRAVDTQMLVAFEHAGARVYRTHGLGFVIRRTADGHTWSQDLTYFLDKQTDQWSGWRPSALLEGEPEPLGLRDGVVEQVGGRR
ncbi:glycosyltransferase [Nocardiopsis sp. EMB25]|uniref:glycosyltransferase n=1 Tax=Nocardiopsis sp. EMB25 TaxID=2835867 RepID=UPI0022851E55|nr:glycosyltransferase [Nocardiopsis sp. EMB25]MCY9782608.1 glycosyltransferase [Nocardiopsis sp. EMB25]